MGLENRKQTYTTHPLHRL